VTFDWGGIAGIAIAYLSGSFPSAYLAGRILKGVDLRTVGSGNLGATNVYRELGLGPALVVLVVDAAKGALPAWLLPGLLAVGFSSAHQMQWWGIAFGVAAIVGHAKPIFLLWKGGGKGVATAAGVFIALTPIPTAFALIAFAGVVSVTRWMSLGSMAGAVTLPVAQFALNGDTPAARASVAVAAFVIWAHRANIARLRAGTEPRLGRSPKGSAT
jgi:glycerol-3-phosphate acyltransferase PlsY